VSRCGGGRFLRPVLRGKRAKVTGGNTFSDQGKPRPGNKSLWKAVLSMDKYFAFQWHITDNCDQRCQHCYIFSEDNNISPCATPWAGMLSIINNCGEMCAKLERVPYFYITAAI
jgi:hypothetical protein